MSESNKSPKSEAGLAEEVENRGAPGRQLGVVVDQRASLGGRKMSVIHAGWNRARRSSSFAHESGKGVGSGWHEPKFRCYGQCQCRLVIEAVSGSARKPLKVKLDLLEVENRGAQVLLGVVVDQWASLGDEVET